MTCPSALTALPGAHSRLPDILVFLRLYLSSCTLVLLLASRLAAQGSAGYVGLCADSAGTSPCVTVEQFAKLYVIGKLTTATAGGIQGAEFRIEVEMPEGRRFYGSWHPARVQVGDPIDLDPGHQGKESGIRLAWKSCLVPVSGQVLLETIHVVRAATARPTRLFVGAHSAVIDHRYPCAQFQNCSASDSSWHCVTPTDGCCSLPKPNDMGASFVAGLNVETDGHSQKLTAYQLVALLWSEHKLPACFICVENVRPVIAPHGGSAEGLIQDLVSTDPHYRQRTIQGRPVICTTSGVYDQNVHLQGDVCVDQPRFRAAVAYADWLRAHVPGFKNLLPPIFIGDSRGINRQEHITLRRRASVIEHLVQLIGSDLHRLVEVVPAPSGLLMLSTRRLPLDQGARGPLCNQALGSAPAARDQAPTPANQRPPWCSRSVRALTGTCRAPRTTAEEVREVTARAAPAAERQIVGLQAAIPPSSKE